MNAKRMVVKNWSLTGHFGSISINFCQDNNTAWVEVDDQCGNKARFTSGLIEMDKLLADASARRAVDEVPE